MLAASSKQALKLAGTCLGCLRQKRRSGAPHSCPSWSRTGPDFCPTCQCHTKLCASPTAHTAVPIPPTFSGFLANRPSGAAGPQRGAGRRRGPNVAILGPQHTSLTPENKGQLGSAASLTSLITIKRGGDLVTVAALFDSGSESSYCHGDLERLGVTRKAKNFTLETLSMGGEQESVKGTLIGFDCLMSDGSLKQIQLLRHSGLTKANTQLRGKVLTVPRHFAEQWQLEEAELTTPHTLDHNTHLYTRTPRQLSIVIGQDLAHLAPTLLTSYKDQHGFVQIHSCPFSGRLVAQGNRQFPLSSSDVKMIVHRLSTTGFFGSIQEVYGEEPDEDDITTLAMSLAVTSELPLMPEMTHRARPADPEENVQDTEYPRRSQSVDLGEPEPEAKTDSETASQTEMETDSRPDSQKDPVDLVDLDVESDVKANADNVAWELSLVEGDKSDMSESDRSKHINAENKKYLKHGEYILSPSLKARLEKHTQPTLQPRHRLNPECNTCNKCMLCKEGAPGYYKSLEEAVYKKHIIRKKITDFNPPLPPQGCLLYTSPSPRDS